MGITRSSLLPSFLPSFPPSFLPSFLPSFHPSILPSFLPSIPPSILPSFRPSFHPSFHPFLIRTGGRPHNPARRPPHTLAFARVSTPRQARSTHKKKKGTDVRGPRYCAALRLSASTASSEARRRRLASLSLQLSPPVSEGSKYKADCVAVSGSCP